MPRYLVTAGNTREKIDAVRDWGNIFTGNTGHAIARALAEEGDVDLLTSNRAHLEELSGGLRIAHHDLHGFGFSSHAELKQALAWMMSQHRYDGVFMTAAVADYRPVRVYEVVDRRDGPEGLQTWTVRDAQAGKVKGSYSAIAVLGEPTEKLVDLFRHAWGHCGLLVKFKLEVGISREELLRIGDASRRASAADYLVANTLDMVQGPGAGAWLLCESAPPEWVPREQLAGRMRDLVRFTAETQRTPRGLRD